MLIVYFSITSIFLIRYLLKIIRLLIAFIFGSQKENYNGYTLIKTKKDIPPCSFFTYIIIPEKYTESSDLNKIISHEMVHVKQMHSIDTLFLEFCITILWFNPFIWKLKSSIKNTHEYLADEGVIEQGFDTTGYKLLLLENAVGFKLGLANNLNQSITLKRMLMLNKSKSNWKAKLKVLSVIPVVFLLITAFQFKANADKTELPVTIPDNQKELKQQPSFPGGQEAMVQFLISNIVYPAVAKEKGIQGKVYVSFTVKKDGSIADVKVIRSVNPLLDAEAERVIKSMPKWIPGADGDKPVDAEMTLPIDFRLK